MGTDPQPARCSASQQERYRKVLMREMPLADALEEVMVEKLTALEAERDRLERDRDQWKAAYNVNTAERDRYEAICKDYDIVLQEYEIDVTKDLTLRTLVGSLRHKVNMLGIERRRSS